MLNFLLFVSFLTSTHAVIQVPLQGTFGQSDLSFNLTVGTPSQKIQVQILDKFLKPDLYFLDARNYSVGFHPEKSSTFVQTGNVTDPLKSDKGMNGTDIIQINGVTLKGKPFMVMSKFWFMWDVVPAYMGFRRHNGLFTQCNNTNGCTSFLQAVLRDQPEKVLTVAFNKINNTVDEKYAGQLVFGSKAPKLCQSDWGFVPEVVNPVKNREQWMFNVDKITIGKYSFSSSTQGKISFESNIYFYFPTTLYQQIAKVLGAVNNTVPCSSPKQDISFQLGNKEFKIPSDVYRWNEPNKFGECSILLNSYDNDYLSIPSTAFSNYCILYDYEKIRVGFSKRV